MSSNTQTSSILERKTFSYDDVTLNFYAIKDMKTGKVWMSGSHIAESLGYSKPRNAIINHVFVENKCTWSELLKKLDDNSIITPANWHPHTVMINEVGVKRLLMKSRLSNAQVLQEWVCSEVLPSLEQTLTNFNEWTVKNKFYVKKLLDAAVIIKEHNIYIATHKKLEEENIYKIGHTSNLKRRHDELNSASPYNFEYIYTAKVTDGYTFEQFLHKLYADSRVKREFFRFNDINKILKDIELFVENFK